MLETFTREEQDKIYSRFMNKIQIDLDTGCWMWVGSGIRYGKITIEGKSESTHRLSYEYHKGSIPKGNFVMHTCDVPRCCNPDHLVLGTPKLNMEDKHNKGRGNNPTGELHPRTVTNEKDVVMMYLLHNVFNIGAQDLGLMFGLKRRTVTEVVRGRNWKHITQGLL